MKQETVVQVHKIVKTDGTTTTTTDKSKRKDADDRNESNRSAPSRDISVDEESQINSKILSLIESEMIRDANKHTHFTESRPQSLSFYEDEKAPEELSGNLELLSPEERKHFKRRRDYSTDDLNAYNVIQDLYKNNSEENLKKSKWRKKRHGDGGSCGVSGGGGGGGGDNELGDSRETMLPKEKKKNKKKKRESTSPNNKRKHKRRGGNGGGGGDNDNDNINNDNNDLPTPRTDIVCTLDELQDDVFENNYDTEYNNSTKFERKSPKKSDSLYIQQKKNKYKHVQSPKKNNNNNNNNNKITRSLDGGNYKKFNHPLDFAIFYQKYWIRFSMLCHGLLAGLGFGHWLYILSNIYVQNQDFISHYSHFSEIYVSFFYFFCIVCIISVCEKTDVAQFSVREAINFKHINKNFLIISIYFVCLIIHLIAAKIDYKFTLSPIDNGNATTSILLITEDELIEWNHLSSWRSILAFISWIIVGLLPPDNTFYNSLQNLEKFKK